MNIASLNRIKKPLPEKVDIKMIINAVKFKK